MPLPDTPEQNASEPDPLSRFRNWRGFLAASIVLNLLFIYGMLGAVSDPIGGIWYKTLAWLPFNAIATAVYIAIMARLAGTPGGPFYRVLCILMIVLSWSVMLGA